jgi:hypothetical protein
MTPINDPAVVAEVRALHEQYETALVKNDVKTLTKFFWNSPHSLRFGVRENLYGAKEIEAFRKERSPIGLDRKIFNVQIVAFGSQCAVVTLEFLRGDHHGRQSQVWWKFPEGWKVASAHVSFMYEIYAEEAAAFIGVPIPPQNLSAVSQNLERAAKIAAPVFNFALTDEIQCAPKFEP